MGRPLACQRAHGAIGRNLADAVVTGVVHCDQRSSHPCTRLINLTGFFKAYIKFFNLTEADLDTAIAKYM